jgi:DNA repair ATPase RecN
MQLLDKNVRPIGFLKSLHSSVTTGQARRDILQHFRQLFHAIGNKRMKREGLMNKERLEWVMSGLSHHALTKAEDQFLKTALEHFDKNNALTDLQEEKLEALYKEKSRLIPNKDHFAFKESPKKAKPRRPHWKHVV